MAKSINGYYGYLQGKKKGGWGGYRAYSVMRTSCQVLYTTTYSYRLCAYFNV